MDRQRKNQIKTEKKEKKTEYNRRVDKRKLHRPDTNNADPLKKGRTKHSNAQTHNRTNTLSLPHQKAR